MYTNTTVLPRVKPAGATSVNRRKIMRSRSTWHSLMEHQLYSERAFIYLFIHTCYFTFIYCQTERLVKTRRTTNITAGINEKGSLLALSID